MERAKAAPGLSTDNNVAWYLLNLADVAEVKVAPGSVALSSSIAPGVRKLGTLFTCTLLQNCVHMCHIASANLLFIIRTQLKLHAAWVARVVVSKKICKFHFMGLSIEY